MSKANIVFLDRETLSSDTALRPPDISHRLQVYQRTDIDQAAERIQDADIVIVNKVPLRRAAIEAAENLKLVAVAATGYNCVDLEACRQRNVAVCNIRSYAQNTVPEHTFALLLALRRNIVAYRQSVIEGRWQAADQFCYFDYPISDLAGSTLGVIGDGVLGQAVARLGEAFGMKVLFAAHKGREGMGSLYTPFETVMRCSDVITLHCPLTSQTHNLIGKPEFKLMTQKPLLINTARGGLVDEEALGWALDEGWISGVGFDVVSEEPPRSEHALVRLAERHNVILTPHVAWASQEAMQSLANQLVENIEAFWRGEPRNLVT